MTYHFTFLTGTYSNKIFYINIVHLCYLLYNMLDGLQVVRLKDGAYGSCWGRRPGQRAPGRLREQRPAQTPSRAQLSPGPTRLMSHTQGHSVRQPSIRMHPLITLASRSTHHRNSIYRFVNPETFQTITDNTVWEFAVVLLIGPSQFVEVLMFTLSDVSCLEA